MPLTLSWLLDRGFLLASWGQGQETSAVLWDILSGERRTLRTGRASPIAESLRLTLAAPV